MIRKFLLLCALFFLSACTLTSLVWKNGYQDRIHNFVVSQDGKYIGFLGAQYHYVLIDDYGFLKDLLSSKVREIMMINTDKTVIKVDHKNNLTGEIFIETTDKNFPKEYRSFLQAMGFKNDESTNVLYLKIKVSGKRYMTRFDQDLSELKLPSLTVPYKIFITEEMSPIKTACAAVLTPITVTLDGVILIGKVVLIPWRGN